jgi:hypothetical protein
VERGNLRLRCERKSHKWKNHEDESTDAQARGGTARSSNEVCDKQMERRGGVMEPNSTANQRWEELMSEAKPFKFKKLRHHIQRARRWIARVSRRESKLFAHWQLVPRHGSMMGAV